MKNERLLNILGEIDDRHIAEAAPAASISRRRPLWLKWGTVAACVLLLITACFGTFSAVAEAEEYNAAVRFFDDHGMSTDGLTRGEIKAVYHDITTKSFTYSKTAEVIKDSIYADNVGGYEISQDDPTPEDIENLWNYMNNLGGYIIPAKTGVFYRFYSEYRYDSEHRVDVHAKSYIEKYDGEELIWRVSIYNYDINNYKVVSDGVIAYGEVYTWSSAQETHTWMTKIDTNGNVVWEKMLNNGFDFEYICDIVENDDGSYAVFSRGDWEYLCFSQYDPDGNVTHFNKTTEMGEYGILGAARFEDGYIMRLGRSGNSRIVRVDREGNITDAFTYSNENSRYFITDMIEFNGNIYLSAYAVPHNDAQEGGSENEIMPLIHYLSDNYDTVDIPGEELTPIVRNYFTALLLVCEPETGRPQEFFSAKGSLGSKLSVSDTGELIWDVESITSTFYSPFTSSFIIGGTCRLFRYSFDASGILISQEKTDETVPFRK